MSSLLPFIPVINTVPIMMIHGTWIDPRLDCGILLLGCSPYSHRARWSQSHILFYLRDKNDRQVPPETCSLCPVSKSGNRKTIWKYNAFFHLLAEHSTSRQRPPEVPPQFWIDTLIQHAEEQALGITTDETDRFRAENTIPGSDDIDMWAQGSGGGVTPSGSPEKQPRERSGTQSTTGSDSNTVAFDSIHTHL
jgi:hypothetical protein